MRLLQLLWLMLALSACGAAQSLQPDTAVQSNAVLQPLQSIMGGRLAQAVDATGTPSTKLHGFVNFIAPGVLAARGPDLYVGDTATGRLYRWDSLQQALSVVQGVTVAPRMRLQVAADLSLYILDPDHAVILHLTRGGQLVQKISSRGLAMNLGEFMLDERMGRLIASDQLGQRLLRVPLAGQIISVLPESEADAFKGVSAVNSHGEQMYVLDGGCVCIVRLDAEGRVQERYGSDDLVQPFAMVTDRYGRQFVADRFDRSLKVFYNGEIMASLGPEQLHIVNPSALALDEDTLYIADAAGSRVALFRIRPPVGDVLPAR